jgi:hypothetical protein
MARDGWGVVMAVALMDPLIDRQVLILIRKRATSVGQYEQIAQAGGIVGWQWVQTPDSRLQRVAVGRWRNLGRD